MKKKIIIRIIIGVCVVGGLLFYYFYKNDYFLKEETKVEEATADTNYVYVYVSGEVYNPKVFYVTTNTTLSELFKLARLKSNADTSSFNLSEYVVANGNYIIPSYIYYSSTIISESSMSYSNLININTATITELMELPGIGEVRAKKITDYRASKGKIDSYEILKNLLSGISDADFETIKTRTTF